MSTETHDIAAITDHEYLTFALGSEERGVHRDVLDRAAAQAEAGELFEVHAVARRRCREGRARARA